MRNQVALISLAITFSTVAAQFQIPEIPGTDHATNQKCIDSCQTKVDLVQAVPVLGCLHSTSDSTKQLACVCSVPKFLDSLQSCLKTTDGCTPLSEALTSLCTSSASLSGSNTASDTAATPSNTPAGGAAGRFTRVDVGALGLVSLFGAAML
ncbi:hypothetical protein BKA62DRAFT_701986 [Auriculariales sp. MPI-PUGE-AT-0066]|nr:hypothetical protein BKA62DRAFT_701986 [Auriculariales sp. MPI-PUGE-AT-0066]